MKTIVLFRRRPDLTRDRFRDHYETKHVPLAIRHVEFMKYVRNHVVSGDEVGFDAMSEFWLADPPAAASLASSSAGAQLREDEARFMMEERFRATAEERLVAGAPRGVETVAVRRYALMLTRPPDIAEPAFITFVNNWALRLFAGRNLTRVTMDVVRAFPDSTFPADAIVSLWPNEQFEDSGLGSAPAVIALAGILALEVHETPRATLAAAF